MNHFEIISNCPKCGTECRDILPKRDKSQHIQCSKCGKLICRIVALKGSVYVLSNPKMPGLYKIGCTTREVEERISELNSATGVPVPFEVEAYFFSATPFKHESEIHRRLARYRVTNREFFELELIKIVHTVDSIVGRKAAYLHSSLNKQRCYSNRHSKNFRWYCGLCKYQWETEYAENECPKCKATSIVQLSS
jgi:hypothetical protein